MKSYKIEEKTTLHERNLHRFAYDFEHLIKKTPRLKEFISKNKFGNESLDFSDKNAVKTLNQALLKEYYEIEFWDFPENYLIPPIPGRVDYIHYVADILSDYQKQCNKKGKEIKVLDIGVGANCIYPIIGNRVYDWKFIGSDVDPDSIQSAQKIIDHNPNLHEQIELRLQKNHSDIFKGIILPTEKIHLTLCNPPFHRSAEDANEGTKRKLKNLSLTKKNGEKLNFGGVANELWCEGGEVEFIRKMILESKIFAKNCLWFTTFVSKKTTLSSVYFHLKKVNAVEVKTVEMAQGQKISRFVAWSFLNKKEQFEFR